jgi:Meiotically up-regulated gene 113
VIYVMQGRHDADRVKIGLTSGAEEKRRRSLNTGHGSPLTVLHLLPGDRSVEEGYHDRFVASNVPGTREWFFRTDEIEQWLKTLQPYIEAEPHETALAYLKRVGTPEALAAIESWKALEEWGKSIGSCSHTLWDMLSGAKGRIEPMFNRVSVVLGVSLSREARARGDADKKERVFYFPLLMEACVRQGTTPPVGSKQTRIRPNSHRRPQPNRWGTKLKGAQ